MATNFNAPFSLTQGSGLNATLGPGAYSDNMWSQLESLRDPLTQLQLARKWKADSLWRNFNSFKIAMRNPNGSVPESVTIKGVFDMEPTVAPIGTYQIWLPNNYTDTWSQTIYFKHYGDKVGLHKYDDMVQAYMFNNQAGLVNLARTLLGESATLFMDKLIRDAYLKNPFASYQHGTASFAGLDGTNSAHHFDPDVAMAVWMEMAYKNVPLATDPSGNGTRGTMICVTTPSVIHDIQAAAGSEWHSVYQYANPSALLQYEAGMYKNVRFVANNRNVLWNCGDISYRATFDNAASPGDGASDALVDGVYKVGQDSSIVTKGIAVTFATGNSSDVKINDVVTIHQTTTADFGVTDGVDYREGTARIRRIVKIDVVDASHATLYFDRPLFDDFPAGTYVTFGQDIHPSIFIAGPDAVVTGVGEPITPHALPPIDDVQGIWRFSWDGYFDTVLFRPEVAFIHYSAGTAPKYGIASAP